MMLMIEKYGKNSCYPLTGLPFYFEIDNGADNVVDNKRTGEKAFIILLSNIGFLNTFITYGCIDIYLDENC